MAPLILSNLRLIYLGKSYFSSKALSSTISQGFEACKYRFRVQNTRVYSNDSPKTNAFGVPLEPRKKTVPIPKILLLSSEGKVIEQLTLEKAEHLAKRRNLNLVNVIDVTVKSSLPTYKLMSKDELFEEKESSKKQKTLEKKSLFKSTKDFVVSNKISVHDLETMIKKMSRSLLKNHKVRIYIASGGQKEIEATMTKTIESEIATSGKFEFKKVQTGKGVKLYVTPIVPDEPKEEKAL